MSQERVNVGIAGLDDMLKGGLLPKSICAIIGTYGTGKTTFALEFVWDGLKKGENVIYISLEESDERIIEYMKMKGWNITQYLNKTLYVIKLDPTEFELANNMIKKELPKLISDKNASRVVIDPISLFEDLFQTDAERRREMFNLIKDLRRDKSCTIMMTSETHKKNAFSSRHALIEYLADTVILLRYIHPSDKDEVHLALEVVKMRMSAHSREIKPYEIMQDSVMVYSEANVF